MAERSGSRREPDDATARQSLEVSEDVQPVATDDDAGDATQGSLQGTAASERPDTPDDLPAE